MTYTHTRACAIILRARMGSGYDLFTSKVRNFEKKDNLYGLVHVYIRTYILVPSIYLWLRCAVMAQQGCKEYRVRMARLEWVS